MNLSQGIFLAICFTTAALFTRASYVSLRHGWRYRERIGRNVRFFSGAAVSAMLALVVLSSGYEQLAADGAIPVAHWFRAAVDFALSCLFLSILKGIAIRDHREVRLETASQTDPLTQLPNRAGFDVDAAGLLEECAAKGLPVSVAMLDIDRFKAVNDGWGHPAGDEVLRSLARVASETTRGEDVLARYGGEEFILLLKGVGPDAAQPMVERLRKAISNRVAHPSGEGRITVSAGIAAVQGSGVRSLKPAIKRADEALYMAKDTGRDRSVISPADQVRDQAGAPGADAAMAR